MHIVSSRGAHFKYRLYYHPLKNDSERFIFLKFLLVNSSLPSYLMHILITRNQLELKQTKTKAFKSQVVLSYKGEYCIVYSNKQGSEFAQEQNFKSLQHMGKIPRIVRVLSLRDLFIALFGLITCCLRGTKETLYSV